MNEEIIVSLDFSMCLALLQLPTLLKEDKFNIFKFDDEDIMHYPKICSSSLEKETFDLDEILSEETFSVVVEGCTIARNKNFVTAFAVMFTAYYVFNIAYPAALISTLTFIQKDILQIHDKAARISKVFTLMSKLRHCK